MDALVRTFNAIHPLTAVPLTVARGPVSQGPFPRRYWMYTTGAGTEETDPCTDRYLPRVTDVAGRLSTTRAIEVTATDGLILPGAPVAGEVTQR